MRHLMTLIFTITTTLSAMSQEDTQQFKQQLVELDSSMISGESLLPLATEFISSEIEKHKWLPYYYASYCYVMEAYKSDSLITDSLLDKSVLYIQKADSLCDSGNKTDKSEIFCVKSLIASARITVNPTKRGMKYGMKSSQMMDKAKNLDPNNPRVYFLEAQSIIYTPEEYGGGCENAKPQLKLALEKYKKFKPTTDLHPNWGEEEVKKILQQCSK